VVAELVVWPAGALTAALTQSFFRFFAAFPDDDALWFFMPSGQSKHESICVPHLVGFMVPACPFVPLLLEMQVLQ